MEYNREKNSNKFKRVKIFSCILTFVAIFLLFFGSFFDFVYLFIGIPLIFISFILTAWSSRKEIVSRGTYGYGTPEERTQRLDDSNQRYSPLDNRSRNMVTCQVCGTLNKRDAKFCNNCGQAL